MAGNVILYNSNWNNAWSEFATPIIFHMEPIILNILLLVSCPNRAICYVVKIGKYNYKKEKKVKIPRTKKEPNWAYYVQTKIIFLKRVNDTCFS